MGKRRREGRDEKGVEGEAERERRIRGFEAGRGEFEMEGEREEERKGRGGLPVKQINKTKNRGRTRISAC